MSLLQFHAQPSYDGFDDDSSPDQIALTKGRTVQNLLVDRPGRLPMRGPLNASSIVLQGGTSRVIGLWAFNDNVLVGYKVGATPAKIDPWSAPFRKAAASGDLATGLTTADHVALTTGTVTHLVANADQVPVGRGARVGAYVYGVSFDSVAAAVVENGGNVKRRRIMRWDGTATIPTVYTNAPEGAQDVISHYQRLFALGGRDVPGGAPATIEQNTLYYSIIGGPTADAVASWKDPVSGLVNKIVVESDDLNDFGVGLAKVGTNLLIFKRRSMNVLYGYSSSTFSIKPYSQAYGCLDARSICQWEGGCFFMSDQGFMYFDGAQLINTTETLRSTALASALAAVGDGGVDNGFAIATRLPNGYIGLSVGTLSNTAADSTVAFCGLYHVQRRAWAGFTTGALTAGKPVGFGRSVNIPFLIDDDRLVRCDKITAPELAGTGEYGIDRLDQFFTFALVDGNNLFNGTANSLKNQESLIEMFPGSSGTTFPIPSKWVSRLYPLSTPFLKSKMQKFLLDYIFQVLGGVDGGPVAGWYVTLTNGQGQTILTETQVPSQGDPSSYSERRRWVKDVFKETSDIQITVQWKGTASQLKKAEILGADLEFEAAQTRRSE